MNKKFKLLIFLSIAVISSVTAVYAVSLISASDVIYDNKQSGSSYDNVQGAIDDLYGIKGTSSGSSSSTSQKSNLITYITNLAKTDTTNLAYDGTSDNNLRYIGSDPNNYVSFNGELWRIIGVMNNVKDSNGTSASRVKLIRAESIGDLAWDTNNSKNWSESSLENLLNDGDYYNRSGSYSDSGLTVQSRAMISNVTWNLGVLSTTAITPNEIYKEERGTLNISGIPIEWIGKIGLIYPSDYGYAVGESIRSSCLSTNMNVYNTSNCHTSNWLYASNQWSINVVITESLSNHVIRIRDYDGFISSPSTGQYGVMPTLYLSNNIKRVSGSGTSSDPYIISTVTTYTDESNASPPVLDDEGKLIPVTLDDDGTVTMLSEDDEDWYSYNNKLWANAVILIDSPSKTYTEGDIILESDIESYFVWIPKYKYRLWNTGTASKTAHEIDIVFDTTNTTDVEGVSCATPMTSGATGNCDNGEYMTHPAFISLGVNGFWVGKFETGYLGATSTSGAQVTSSDSSKIIVKPNVYSWRYNTVYNMFLAAYNYERSLDSHMMKNTEWGAVAILSHSKYGLGYEVNINNNSSYKTGYSALPSTSQVTYPGTYGDGSSYNELYNTEIGCLASTTGNITGVYDMSGGSYEYMASYVDGLVGYSGFSLTTIANYDSKYFDVYSSKSNYTSYQYRILGDATAEMGPIVSFKDGDTSARYHNSWYADDSEFVESSYQWFHRGCISLRGVLAGQFSFGRGGGNARSDIGSRIVLSP